jgi:type III restriction enzyme
VVCQNTNHSKMVYDYVAGYKTGKEWPDGTPVWAEGVLPLLSNVRDGRPSHRPTTILVDSEQLESGEAMSKDFKAIAAAEIEDFKGELRQRFPGRSTEDLSDEDLLREVMNTVGKPSKLGEGVKGVVSVSMLTEGWDANTVTHILGVRAFGTQLLCEQVVGRGLRRMSYAPVTKRVQVNGQATEIEAFATEYAEVFGVPFSFIPTAASVSEVTPGVQPTRVRALEERADCEIRFPRLVGYRFVLPQKRLTATFDEGSRLVISDAEVPTRTENAPIVGETTILTLDELKARRVQEVAFLLAKLVVERYFPAEGRESEAGGNGADRGSQYWRFPQVLDIARRWIDECVTCKGGTFPQMLLFSELAHYAAERIYGAIAESAEGEKILVPILRAYDAEGTTRFVDFDTTKSTYRTDARKCQVSHVVLDSDWEATLAQTLEHMDEVARYAKNHNLGFTIPYTLGGEERSYYPDYMVQIDDGREDLLNLIVEVSGRDKKDKQAKVDTARKLWVPAVNNHGGFGRWAFLEITDPWDAEKAIKDAVAPGHLAADAARGEGPR